MRKTVTRGTLFVCALMSLMLGVTMSVSAQTGTAAPVTGNSAFTGKISKLTPFTVNSNGQDRQVNPAPNVAVVRGGNSATLNDLKVGDQVNVTSNPDNTASKIEATGESGGLPAWLIPLLLALVLLGLLAYFLSRRGKKDSFVLEQNKPNTPNTPRAPR